MKTKLISLLFCLLLAAGCDDPQRGPGDCPDGKCPYAAVPPMDLPVEMRQANYGGGSCMWASTISVLMHQRQYEAAERLRQHAGAASVETVAAVLDRMGLLFAYTNTGDESFLQWCSDTRRGAAIHYYPQHAITFCGYARTPGGFPELEWAVLIDNNMPRLDIRVEKRRFLDAWRDYGGRALTVVYTPTPPRPWYGDNL
jgi:hypothetical protein